MVAFFGSLSLLLVLGALRSVLFGLYMGGKGVVRACFEVFFISFFFVFYPVFILIPGDMLVLAILSPSAEL